jgi:rhodanese-related sulfurtransferase
VNVSVAKQMIDTDPNLVILDVRTQSEYDNGHIQNATLIPSDQLAGRLGELDKQTVILVYCASGGRSATAGQLLVDSGFLHIYNMLGGITAWKSAGYWIEIIHNGNLDVSGTQTLTIENCTYIQNGNIYVSGRLVLNNTILAFPGRYPNCEIVATGNSSIYIENTVITVASGFIVPMGFVDRATIVARNSVLDCVGIGLNEKSEGAFMNVTIFELDPRDSANVTLQDSRVVWTLSLSFQFPQTGDLDNLRGGLYENWGLHQNQSVSNVNYEVTLKNTSVAFWSFGIDSNSDITISDSSIGRAAVSVNQNVVQLDAIRPGHQENLTVGRISLHDVDVNHWLIAVYDISLTLDNCEVYLYPHTNSSISVLASILPGFEAFQFEGLIQLENTTFSGWLSFVSSNLSMKGNAYFLSPRPLFYDSSVTRAYDVNVRNVEDSLLEDAEVTLFDNNDILVWAGSSDSSGNVNFNLTFTDDNYTITLRLEASKGELFATKNITFLSDAPVTLVMNTTATADINNDGSVDIYDAILLANACNSVPSSSNWNSKADLNSDNIVDIYDAIILANHYGKTA